MLFRWAKSQLEALGQLLYSIPQELIYSRPCRGGLTRRRRILASMCNLPGNFETAWASGLRKPLGRVQRIGN